MTQPRYVPGMGPFGAGIRSISAIGALWPLCNRCRHIAQEHDDAGCSAVVRGKCPTCGGYEHTVPCSCKSYEGPSFEEFKKQLTPEEIAHYRWEAK